MQTNVMVIILPTWLVYLPAHRLQPISEAIPMLFLVAGKDFWNSSSFVEYQPQSPISLGTNNPAALIFALSFKVASHFLVSPEIAIPRFNGVIALAAMAISTFSPNPGRSYSRPVSKQMAHGLLSVWYLFLFLGISNGRLLASWECCNTTGGVAH